MKRCCPLWQVNGFSIKCRKTAPTESQSCNESMKSASFEKETAFLCVHSVWSRDCLETAWLCVGCLALFVLMRWEASKDKGLWRFHCSALSFDSQMLRYVLSCYCAEFTSVILYKWHYTLLLICLVTPSETSRAQGIHAKIKSSSFNHIRTNKTCDATMNFALCFSEESCTTCKDFV